MATKQQSKGDGVVAKDSEIMEVDMTAKPMDDEDVDAIIEDGDADLIEMDDGEDGMEKYIEEDLEDGTAMNYDDLVVEDDGESLSNGATVSTTTKDVVAEDEVVEEVLEDDTQEKEQISTSTTKPAAVVVAPQPSNGVAAKAPTNSTGAVTKNTATTESNGYAGNKDQRRRQEEEVDDDRPVSIPSDSDGEEAAARPPPPPLTSKPVQQQQQRRQPPPLSKLNGTADNDDIHEILSDKEDCVMLDDDTPPRVDSSSGARKSAAAGRTQGVDYDDDIQEIIDDPIAINSTTTIQPVSKKMKMSANALPSGTSLLSQNHLAGLPADLSITAGTTTIGKEGGKFSYVDPKSLLNNANKQQQHQLGNNVTNLLAGGGLTISQVTPGSGGSGGSGAVPHLSSNMRATITAVNSNSNSGGVNSSSGSNSNSGSSSNSNKAAPGVVSSSTSSSSASAAMAGGLGNILLPALTDDMFVLEAPSFIVPYIYEKPPSENLRQIVDEMKKELDALKVKDEKPAVTPMEEDSAAVKEKKEAGEEEKKRADDAEEETSDKDKKGGRKGKGGKGRKNGDDSWGESDESTDDEASDSETRTKVLIKDVDTKNIENILLPGTGEKKTLDGKPVAGSDNYFESPLGQFFMNIGMSMVQEHVQGDLLRMQKRKQQREGGKDNIHLQTAINNLMNNLEASRKDNASFKFPAKRCDYCSFKSESGLSMANHYEKPHLKGNVYRCNFCEFEARPAHDILYHMEAVHNMKSKLEKPLSYHQCPNCPFEDNGKSKLARHTLACTKKFVPENNLLPAQDWDPPAKIPRVKPRHGLVGTATAYQAMAAQQQRIQAATGMLNRISSVQPGQGAQNQTAAQMQANAALNLLTANAALLNNNVAMNMAASGGKSRNRASGGGGGGGGNQMGGKNVNRQGNVNPNASRSQQQQQQMNALLLQNNFNQLAAVAAAAKNFNSSQLLQMASQAGILPNAHSSLTIQQSNPGAAASNKSSKNAQQPSISITPLPRQNATAGGSSGGMGNMSGGRASTGGGSGSGADGIPANLPKPGQHPSGNKSSFVICEICDGYIKDLDQLRSHMQLIHKVKIHPKMIYNRPPLNCQKCQYRFFTDQGLERHLLGSHGLVTSSMQEAANCGQDSGRCPICGRVYQWKLLNHVSRDHNMTLKPAHLSYKCTVCTATFSMYKQFENHVYSAHSTVAKKSGDKKGSSSSGGGGGGGSSKSSSGGDSLLKPLKINDEITIIPQPPSKMSKTQTIEIE